MPFSSIHLRNLLAAFLLCAGCTTAGAALDVDPLESFGSLLDLAPDPSLLPDTAPEAPTNSVPADPFLLRLRALDTVTVSNQYPDLPRSEGIQELSRVDLEDLETDVVAETIERISFETLLREAKDRSERGESEQVLTMLQDALNQYTVPAFRRVLYEQIGMLHYQAQNYTDAAVAMEQSLEIQQTFALLSSLAGLYLYTGEIDRAIATLGRVDMNLIDANEVQVRFALNFNYACAYAMKSALEESLSHLEQAAIADPAATLSSLGDPQLDNIRRDDRFKKLSARLREYVLGERPAP